MSLMYFWTAIVPLQIQVLYFYLPMSWRNAILLALTYFVLTVIPEPKQPDGIKGCCYID
jgi:hypothetical protein